jgi:SAM-dependent methyltransferase
VAAWAALSLTALSCRGRESQPPEPTTPASASEAPRREPDVPYEPSPPEVVSVMLELAAVREGDVVYDLGCGDGRVVIEAVRRHRARGVCIDIDPARIREARENAERAGVAGSIRFQTQDLFAAQIGDADVVMLFLWPEVNLRLKPKLERELRPGTRIVSHWHDMGSWQPTTTRNVEPPGRRARPVYVWTLGGGAN